MNDVNPLDAIEIARSVLVECPTIENVDRAIAIIRAADAETIAALEEQLDATVALLDMDAA